MKIQNKKHHYTAHETKLLLTQQSCENVAYQSAHCFTLVIVEFDQLHPKFGNTLGKSEYQSSTK